MMDGKEMLRLLEGRQSERAYNDRPVEKEKLDRITEAGRLSPSASNGQPWKFIVVDDPDLKQKVATATASELLRINGFVRQAPVLIVVIREKSNISSRAGGIIKKKDYSVIDTGIATASMVYQAAAEGLGTCIVGWFDEKKLRTLLGISGKNRIELVITVGYTNNQRRIKIRKPAGEVISYNRY